MLPYRRYARTHTAWYVPMHRVGYQSINHLTARINISVINYMGQTISQPVERNDLLVQRIGECNTLGQRKSRQQTVQRLTGNCDNHSVQQVCSHCATCACGCVENIPMWNDVRRRSGINWRDRKRWSSSQLRLTLPVVCFRPHFNMKCLVVLALFIVAAMAGIPDGYAHGRYAFYGRYGSKCGFDYKVSNLPALTALLVFNNVRES